MNTYKLKPNDYSYSIKLPKTKISVCILRRIESMYNTKTSKTTFKSNSLMKMLASLIMQCCTVVVTGTPTNS